MTTRLPGKLATLTLALAGTFGLTAQAQTWQSALAVATNSEVRATAVVADNVYVTGVFTGTVQIGSTTLTSAGEDEIFVAKWNNASRSFVWAQRAGGANSDLPNTLTVSGTSVYVVGAYSSRFASFGTITLGNNGPDLGATYELFAWKLTDAGTSASTAWALKAGGSASETVQALAVAGNSLYLGGTIQSPITLGPSTLTPAGGVSDGFVARLNDAGTSASWAWAVQAGGPGEDQVRQLVVAGSSVYAGGSFENTATFGSTPLSLTSAGSSDAFVAKLTDAGAYQWAQGAGGPGSDYLRALAVSGSSVYLGGEFAGATAAFGATTLSSAGNTDAYVARLTDAGTSATFAWAQQLGGAGFENLRGLVARSNQLYVAGHFDGANLTLGSTTLPNAGAAGTYDLYVASLLDAGNAATFSWALRGGSTANDYARALVTNGPALYLGGSVGLPAAFGNQTLAGAAGTYAAFVATLTDQLLPTRAATDLPGLSIFPNPAHGAATVRVPAGAGPATVQVLDALGRVLRQAPVAAGQDYALALTGLAPGLYAVRVQVGEATATQRLAVE